MEHLLFILPIVIIVALVLIICITGYVKASTDEAYIITGPHKEPRYLIGKSGIKIPFIEKKDVLKLQLIAIDVRTSSSVPTADYININVDANVNVQIGHTKEMLEKAARNFLNKSPEYIASVAREVLEGNMREIVGKMKLEEMVSDRQKFATLVKENADPDLAAIGLVITSFNVQNFVDNEHVIENLGVDNIVRISKAAAISRAESERDIAIAKAKADKEANDAQVEADTEIAMRQNELAIKRSELQMDADTKKAIADAAYKIQEEEQRKQIEVTTANANIAKQEREIELREKEVAVKEQTLDAEIKKQAEADRYAAQQKADAQLYQRQKDAEAKAFEAIKAAEARKAQAEADRFAKEQEAAGIKAVGEAEADAIRAKAIAEAEGIEKKAEAQAKMGQASVIDMLTAIIPEVAKNVAEPLANVESITMYGEGNASKMVGDITTTMAKIFAGVGDSTGVDVKDLIASAVTKSQAASEATPAVADTKKSEDNFTEVSSEE